MKVINDSKTMLKFIAHGAGKKRIAILNTGESANFDNSPETIEIEDYW